MMRQLLFTVAVLSACTRAHTDKDEPTTTTAAVAPNFAQPPVAPTTTPPPATQVTVELTAVTLADDCGGTAPHGAPAVKAKAKSAEAAKSDRDDSGKSEARRCEQTSMQLAITAADAARITVKSVELFDDAGKSLGPLTASKPTRWSDNGLYETWDELAPAGTMINVSYVLQQPAWGRIGDRWNRTYTLKSVLTIGGVDRAASKQVTLSAPATLPPNVKT